MMNSEQVRNIVLHFAMSNPNFYLALGCLEKCKTEKEARELLDMYWMFKEDDRECLLSIFKKKDKKINYEGTNIRIEER